MKNSILFLIELAVSFLPFILFAFLNAKANVKKEMRHKQFPMPILALVYSIVLLIFLSQISDLCLQLFMLIASLFDKIKLTFIGDFIRGLYTSWGVYLLMVLFNTLSLLAYIIVKRILTVIFGKMKVEKNTFIGSVIELFYSYDEEDDRWFIKDHFGQARILIKTAYYGSCIVSGIAMLISCWLCMEHAISAPFYPVFAVMIIGEMAFFIDGISADEQHSSLQVEADRSKHIAMYPLLRKPLKNLFGDKLAAEGTTVNNGGMSGGAIDDVLIDLERQGGHIGKNYAAFIRKKMEGGLKPNVDYVRTGYDLATGKSLLFNTPFYDKLNPYVFYAMNRELLTGGKVLIVLGRHGTQNDLYQWAERGMQEVSNIPDLWKIAELTGEKCNEEALPDIGIISRSAVHDLDIHRNNAPFLKDVSFVVVVEPSRLVTTAQIGLNLLIKNCGRDRRITFCSVDRNCDGLVDALSHILMTNITEVSATEYPHGMSSYMYWTADNDYLQHRILPGVSRCLGMGTEFSMVALKNQVKKAVWYGGETYPVVDVRWIAKQYYYDLLDYAQLPTNQETFDRCFQTSFNMCNERVNDYSYITVEDDRNNLFETRRNFATIAEQQGFVNVISSEYMLREYMAENTQMFTADPKAIPYITADYARTTRNAILSLSLLLCIGSVPQQVLRRQMLMLNLDATDPVPEIWKELCTIFGCDEAPVLDKKGIPVLSAKGSGGRVASFERDETIVFKREYSVESGKFESVYVIEDARFARIILDDLQNASYIAEQDSKDVYIGTELKGHVYQKYMPGQFFTLNGKYYEMVSTTVDNRILVRRASEHIGGRLAYRQVRNYNISHLEDSATMGALKTVNNIDIHYQVADFSVETPGYWKLRAHNDFDNGDLVKINGVPVRNYHHKQVLKLDFSRLGEAFTDSVRFTLTNLLNEAFVTLFADNQPFISAITPGMHEAPLTYSLTLDESLEGAQQCIFIVEDSQLDIGLLIAVERNIGRIFQIVSDYLQWNDEQIQESLRKQNEPEQKAEQEPFNVYEDDQPEKKKGFFGKIGAWFTGLFKKKPKKGQEDQEPIAQDYMMIYGKPHKLVDGRWVSCSQEEFDARMAQRHRLIDEAKARRTAEKEEAQSDESQDEELTEDEGLIQAEDSADEVAVADDAFDADEAEEAEAAQASEDEADGEAAAPDAVEPVTPALTPREQKKAAREAAKAEKRAAKEQKKASKLEQKLLKKQEKEAKKQEKAAKKQKNEPEPEQTAQPEEIQDEVEPVMEQEQVQSEVEVSEDE